MLGILTSIVAAAAASTAGYASMAPRNQLFGRTFTGLERGSRKLALTYDDGPNDPHTLRLLEVLERHLAKATFFMIGRFVRQKPEIAQVVARAGHAIGNHTFRHPNLIFASPSQIAAELEQCEAALQDVVGEHASIFRPPYGGRRPDVLHAARARGMTPVMWNVTCFDWSAKEVATIERHAARQMRGGDVILLHDGWDKAMGGDRSLTIEATDRILRRYRDDGYEFVTIPEMMKESPGRATR